MRRDFDKFHTNEKYETPVCNGSGSFNHSGILGQKWGRRRYQYEDGSLTEEGRDHYGVGPAREKSPSKRELKKMAKAADTEKKNNLMKSYKDAVKKDVTKMTDDELRAANARQALENNYYSALANSEGAKLVKAKAEKNAQLKEAISTGVVTAGTTIAANIIPAKMSGADVDMGETITQGLIKGVAAGLGATKNNALGTIGKAADNAYGAYKEINTHEKNVDNIEKQAESTISEARKAYQEAKNVVRLSDVKYTAASLDFEYEPETARRVAKDLAVKDYATNVMDNSRKMVEEAITTKNKALSDEDARQAEAIRKLILNT